MQVTTSFVDDAHSKRVLRDARVVRFVGTEDLEKIESGALVVAVSLWKGVPSVSGDALLRPLNRETVLRKSLVLIQNLLDLKTMGGGGPGVA